MTATSLYRPPCGSKVHFSSTSAIQAPIAAVKCWPKGDHIIVVPLYRTCISTATVQYGTYLDCQRIQRRCRGASSGEASSPPGGRETGKGAVRVDTARECSVLWPQNHVSPDFFHPPPLSPLSPPPPPLSPLSLSPPPSLSPLSLSPPPLSPLSLSLPPPLFPLSLSPPPPPLSC